jgi:3-hydroxy-3-methylglutaryl CoA synthase
MAVAAGLNCLNERDPMWMDAICLASTTSPYKEKQCAAIIAAREYL